MVTRNPCKNAIDLQPRNCRCCGKEFVPFDSGDWTCSPVCHTWETVKNMEKARQESEKKFREKLDSIRYIPKLNLKKNPMARVDWVMSLPVEYRGKFTRFFNEDENAYMKDLCKSILAEERQYLGYFVKKDKIVMVRGANAVEPEELPPDTIDNDGTENEDN